MNVAAEDSISQAIKERVIRFDEGRLFTIGDFADLNNDSLVTRTLSRLQYQRADYDDARPIPIARVD